MKQLKLYALLMFIILGAACSTPATPTPSPSPVPTAARPATLRIELPGDADVADIPRMMAIEALRAEGYNVEVLSFSDTILATVAITNGQADLAFASNGSSWAAIQQGAPLVTLLDNTANSFLVATTDAIQKCEDLDGKRVGISSLKSLQTLMLMEYVRKNCSTIKPEYLVISGSNTRMIAMRAGQLDATTMDLFDLLEMEREGAQGFHPFIIYATEFPMLKSSGLLAHREFVSKYPQAIKDYIRAELGARRKIQDPQVLTQEIIQRFQKDPSEAAEIAKIFLEKKIWDVNGGMSPEAVQAIIDFSVASELLEPGLSPAAVVDLAPLSAVLDEIGRK